MRLAIGSVGLVSPRSTWLSIGALTPERTREVAQREVHRLAQGAHARPDVDGGVFQDSHDTNVRYRIQPCKRTAPRRRARRAGRRLG